MYDVVAPVNFIRTSVEPNSYVFTINLDRDITTPQEFQEELYMLRHAKDGDVVHIYLTSCGGSAETMKVFLTAMGQCEAHIITEVTGDIASAATFIFLAGDEYRVSDDAELMFHNVFYGAIGKGSDVKRQVDFAHRVNEKLVRKYYKHFLTEEEILDLLNGKEFWMDAEEVMQRLEKRTKSFEAENVVQFNLEDAEYILPSIADQLKDAAGMIGMPMKDLMAYLNSVFPNIQETVDVTVNLSTNDTRAFKEISIDSRNSMTVYADGSITDISSNGTDTFDSLDDFLDSLYDRTYMAVLAKALGASFPPNTGEKKLRTKIESALQKVIDELNK